MKAAGNEMEWVIIRPGGLNSEPGTGKGVLTEDNKVTGIISREDVAELVVQALRSDKSVGKTLTAVDKNQVRGSTSFEIFEL